MKIRWKRGHVRLFTAFLALALASCAPLTTHEVAASQEGVTAPPEAAVPKPGLGRAKPDTPKKPAMAAGDSVVAMTPPEVNAGTLKSAIDRAVNQLISTQGEDGSYGFVIPGRGHVGHSGVTALVLHALATCPRKYKEEDGPFVTKAVDYLKTCVQPDGGIYEKG